ncbi:molybdopterin-synthase adenylyltransferase MoeB [Mariniflexile sp.]|uniref:molybdopterin-synthase adenylyltransferase MoeB n=1 Tax=Mariniflexile sp. TaxID=1979402 RepID=UPI003561E76C
MILTQEEKKQYNRHLILNTIGEEGQLKLKKAKVLVIGAGGLGCPILQYLTAAGVGKIGIIDDDIIEQSNLQRQILFTVDDIGKPKVAMAAAKLSRLNPFVKFETYYNRLNTENVLELFKKYDIIVDGSDNFSTRYLVNDASVITNKPVVFGSIFKFEGQVSVFNYNNGPTYRCLYPNPPKPTDVPNCSEIGVLGVLPAIIGSIQATEVIKIICNIGCVLSGQLLIYDALGMQQTKLNFAKNMSNEISKLEDNYEVFCGFSEAVVEIDFKEFNKHKETYNLLDVRSYLERSNFHIGGIHIPLNELENRLNEVPKNKPLLVYCKSGIRSKQAIEIIKNSNSKMLLYSLKNGLGTYTSE